MNRSFESFWFSKKRGLSHIHILVGEGWGGGGRVARTKVPDSDLLVLYPGISMNFCIPEYP